MKKLILSLFLLVSFNAFAQVDGFYISAEITLSPIKLTQQLFKGTTAASAALTVFTFLPTIVQCRGVADQEQLRDDLLAYDQDVSAGLIRQAQDIRQPALKEIVFEIMENKEAMREVEAAIPVGTNVDKITASLALQLL